MDENDLKRLLGASAAEMRIHFDASVQRVEQKMDSGVTEVRRHFDVTIERLETKFPLVAEAVVQLEEKSEREHDETRQDMRRGFAETQAMIKFSHAELDRRVRALEGGLSDLLARVERLEGSTH
ncbi:MAG TPA: hypothetical protein VNM92_02990 [Thermoanaerobaculia bacterium]|nr:hypothetical protein [Thermoanaerobaculia bacterium]